MPPRYSYWTILAGGLPTSFRAADRDELLPTLRRLQERHPDAEMKWFARGKLWPSPEAAREAPRRTHPHRGPDWRPGGDHRDPREPFKKAKRERNQAHRQRRFARKHANETAGPDDGATKARVRPSAHPPHRAPAPRRRDKPESARENDNRPRKKGRHR